jgi:hypothetical protein
MLLTSAGLGRNNYLQVAVSRDDESLARCARLEAPLCGWRPARLWFGQCPTALRPEDLTCPYFGSRETRRHADSPTRPLADSPTHRLTDSPTRRLADSPTPRHADTPIRRYADTASLRATPVARERDPTGHESCIPIEISATTQAPTPRAAIRITDQDI